jgi:RNA polymerase sigma-32 factor
MPADARWESFASRLDSSRKEGVVMNAFWEHGALSAYRAELASRKALPAAVERELVHRWRAGDQDAGRRLIEACLPFVMTIALEYRRWGIPLEDIVQEGNIGLLKAADRFDPERGTRLVTYAAYWVRAEIRDHVVRGYRIVRLGASKTERRALRVYRKTRERDPAALAAASGLTVERAEALMPLLQARDVSLDERSADGVAPLDRMPGHAPSPEETVAASEEKSLVEAALGRAVDELPPREREIMRVRWLTETPETLEQVGHRFGISKERVRQIEERAKRRVRERLEVLVAERSTEKVAA